MSKAIDIGQLQVLRQNVNRLESLAEDCQNCAKFQKYVDWRMSSDDQVRIVVYSQVFMNGKAVFYVRSKHVIEVLQKSMMDWNKEMEWLMGENQKT